MGTTRRDQSSSGAEPDGGHGGAIAPEDSFLIQVRGTSRPAESAISGRVEHLHSGSSEQFGSLAGLLDFLSRYIGGAVPTAQLELRPSGGSDQQ
jgi:hypothetical protein